MVDYEFLDCKSLSKMIDRFPFRTGCLIVDTETTGLSPLKTCFRSDGSTFMRKNDWILHLSVIDPMFGSVIFDDYFKPGKKKSWPKAEAIHGISYDKVSKRRMVSERLGMLNEIFSHTHVLIGYNVCFDMQFLISEGIEFPKLQYVIDVMEDFACYNGDLHPYWNTYTWKKLTYAAKKTGYDSNYLTSAHNSLADCFATRHVAYYLEEHWTPYYPEDYGLVHED